MKIKTLTHYVHSIHRFIFKKIESNLYLYLSFRL